MLCERDYRGAATKEIASRAGLSEMTLFRHFPAKNDLVRAALERATEPFRAGAAARTDDVRHDLAGLAAGYVAFVDAWPALVDRVLPELATDDALGPIALGLMRHNADGARDLVLHHQAGGRLVDVDPADLIREFLGPLLARAALRHVLPVVPLDVEGYIARFLDGSGEQPQW